MRDKNYPSFSGHKIITTQNSNNNTPEKSSSNINNNTNNNNANNNANNTNNNTNYNTNNVTNNNTNNDNMNNNTNNNSTNIDRTISTDSNDKNRKHSNNDEMVQIILANTRKYSGIRMRRNSVGNPGNGNNGNLSETFAEKYSGLSSTLNLESKAQSPESKVQGPSRPPVSGSPNKTIDVNGVRTTPPRVNEQQVLRINAGQRSSSNPPPRQQLINEHENNLNNNSSNSNNNLNNNSNNNNSNNNLNNLNNSNLNNSNNHHDYFEIEYVQSEVRTKSKDLEIEPVRSGEKKSNVKENRSAVNDGLGPGQNQGLGPGPGQGQGQGASQGQGQGLSPDTAKSKSSPKTVKSTSNSPISPTLVSEERPVKEEKSVKSKYSHRSLSYMMDEMSMITAMTDENILAAKNMSVSNNQKESKT